MRAAEFFAYARERHLIHLRRSAGVPAPWTDDQVLQQYRFCNVFRELDRTTTWFRQYVRDPLAGKPEVLLATVLFRWFSRIEAGEAIFRQEALGLGGEEPGETAWDHLLHTTRGPVEERLGAVRAALRQYCGDGPYVTGAYMVKTPTGLDKVDGVLWCVERFMEDGVSLPDGGRSNWRHMAVEMLEFHGTSSSYTLEDIHCWLMQYPFMGPFNSYEVVTDLRHTSLLSSAPDIMTWANPGPGARRGLNRLHSRELEDHPPRGEMVGEMQALLALSRDHRYWPQELPDRFRAGRYLRQADADMYTPGAWPAWEMRDVEHTLCEWDKYERAARGEGRLKRRYP